MPKPYAYTLRLNRYAGPAANNGSDTKPEIECRGRPRVSNVPAFRNRQVPSGYLNPMPKPMPKPYA